MGKPWTPHPPQIQAISDPYPEHTKLAAISDESNAIGAFLDWLDERHQVLCERDDTSTRWWPVRRSINDILADYFGIDRDQLEAEKRAMLDSIRAKQAAEV